MSSDMNKDQLAQLQEAYKKNLSEMAMQLPPLSLSSMFFWGPLMERSDREKYKSSQTSMILRYSFGLVGGLAISMMASKRNVGNLLNRPLIQRLPARFLFFSLPLWCVHTLSFKKRREIRQIEAKYKERRTAFQRTGDFNYIDPSQLLFEEYIKRP